MDWFFTDILGREEIHTYERRLNKLLDDEPDVTVSANMTSPASTAKECCRPAVRILSSILTSACVKVSSADLRSCSVTSFSETEKSASDDTGLRTALSDVQASFGAAW
jgi:hypothetical protein